MHMLHWCILDLWSVRGKTLLVRDALISSLAASVIHAVLLLYDVAALYLSSALVRGELLGVVVVDIVDMTGGGFYNRDTLDTVAIAIGFPHVSGLV